MNIYYVKTSKIYTNSNIAIHNLQHTIHNPHVLCVRLILFQYTRGNTNFIPNIIIKI